MKLQIAILCLLAATLSAQQPESGQASISGRVISAVDGSPMPGALILVPGRSLHKVWAGSDGRFRLNNLPSRSVVLVASKAGFHRGEQRLLLTADAAVEGLIIRLLPQAVIAGTAVGPDGEPLQGATALLWQQADRLGELTMLIARGAEIVNDLGEFRFHGLRPGDYIVTLEPTTKPGRPGAARLTHTPMIYPPVGSVEEFATLRVKAGERIENVDFRAAAAPQTGVSGEIIGSGEQACVRCAVGFYRLLGETYVPDYEMTAAADGSFYVEGLEPGHYVVASRDAWSRQALGQAVVAPGKVTNTRAYLTEGAEINVVVKLLNPPEEDEATGRRRRPQPSVQFDYLGPVLIRGTARRSSRPLPRGEGVTEYQAGGLAPGPYSVRVGRIPQGGYIGSLLLDGQPLLNGRFEMTADTISREIELVIAFDSGVVEGIVETDSDLAVNDARIYLLPQTPVLPSDASQTIADESGAFSHQVAPGRYEAYALPRGSTWNLADPLDRLRLAAYRTVVDVRSGQISTTRLKLGPISAW